MVRPLFALSVLIVLTNLSSALADNNVVGTSVATELRNGGMVQKSETHAESNLLPAAASTIEADRSAPIPSSGRISSEIRWTGFDVAAIGQDVATDPDGDYTFIGWNLNNMRASFHNNLSNVPLWEYYSDPNVWRNYVAVSPDADVTANGSYHNLRLFDKENGSVTFDFIPEDGRIAGPVAVSRDGSLLVCATISPLVGGTHRLYAFNPPSETPIWTFDFDDTQSTGVYGITISADGQTIAVNGKFYGWVLNPADGSVRTEFEIANTESAIALSGDASVMALAELSGYVKAYTWNTGALSFDLLWQYRIPPGLFTNWASSIDVSADGLTVMAGSLIFLSSGYDGHIYLFDTFGDGLPLWIYTGAGDMVDEVALSDDGSIAAAVSWGDLSNLVPDILVFERYSNTPVFSVNTPGSMFSLDMSADGKTVVAGGKSVHARTFGSGGYAYNIEVDLGGGAISGTVTLDGSPDNEGAIVEVLGTFREATTNASGDYVVQNVPAGTYDVRVSKLGYGAETLSGISVTEGDTTENIDATLFATGDPPVNLTASHGLDSKIELAWSLPSDMIWKALERKLAADPVPADMDAVSVRSRLARVPAPPAVYDLSGIPDSIRVYRASRSGGPYYVQHTLEGSSTTWTDSAVFPLRDYYYTVTAIYGEGESIYSNEAYGTVDSSFLQFAVTAPHRDVVPTIDGVLSAGEWTDAFKLDISDIFGYGGGVPLPRGSVFMHFKYDSLSGTLYVAGEDFLNDDALTDAEGFGLYFDDNNDNQFEPSGAEPLTREGNYWAYWYAGGPLVRFREIYTGGGVNPVIDTVWDAQVAASVGSGHFTGEVSIPISFFDKNHLQVYGPDKTVGAGLFMINRNSGVAVFDGWWPQTMNSVFTPSGFGDITIPITLLAPPAAPTDLAVDKQGDALLVSWSDPTTGINGDPLTVPVTLQLNRNGVDIGEFGLGTESYLDTSVAPMGWYEYKLRGFIDVDSPTEYFGPYSETVGNFAVADPNLYEIRYDDGIPEVFYVVDFTYNDNKFGIRFTPQEYPATVYRVEAFTNNGNSPILVSIYDDNNGLPGTMLTGEYPGESHQTVGVDSFTVTIPGTDPPTIDEGDFWVILSYLPTSPGAPGIGGDLTAPIDSRSWFYTTGSGWVQIGGVDLVVRASVTGSVVSADGPTEVPVSFALYQNYPNPFNPETEIRFDLPEKSHVSLILYDILGREVGRLVDEEIDAGIYNTRVDAANLSSGVYFYRIQAGHFTQTKKMLVIR